MRRVAVTGWCLMAWMVTGCAANASDAGLDLDDVTLSPNAMQLPPSKCAAGDVGCDGVPDGPVRACGSTRNQCFGAVGINCTGDSVGLLPSESLTQVGCEGNSCWVNAGSWAHDQCCFATPSGRWCNGPGSALNAGCGSQWDMATHRYAHNLGWRRTLNKCTINTTGTVPFAEYCAPGGTIVASTDVARCCGGSRAYAASDAARAAAQGVIFDGSFTPAVCVGAAPAPPPPPPPPAAPWSPATARRCTATSQCPADQVCIPYPNVAGKICAPAA